MNDPELKAALKSSPVPTRAAGDREALTSRVMARLHRNHAVEPEPRGSWLAPLAWGTGIAFAAVVFGFVLGRANPALARNIVSQYSSFRSALFSGAAPEAFVQGDNTPQAVARASQ